MQRSEALGNIWGLTAHQRCLPSPSQSVLTLSLSLGTETQYQDKLPHKQAEQSWLLYHSFRTSGHKGSSPPRCQNTSLKTQSHSKLHTSSWSYVWVSSAPQTQPRTEELLWLLGSLGDCSPWLARLLVCCFVVGSLEEQVGGSLIVAFLSLVLHAHTDYVAIPRLS